MRRVDKLVSVYLLGGVETWILIHIEIQGQREEEFAERIYVYHYRIYDKYRRPVVSLAILTDETHSWRPHQYSYENFDCKLSFHFPVIKLLDYEEQQQELLTSENPFAVVVMAQLHTLATRRKPIERYEAKLRLAKMLYQRGYRRQEIIQLFHFIDWIMVLPDEIALQFRANLLQFEEEARMPYVSSIERLAIQEGRQEGRQEVLREMIVETLGLRFDWFDSNLVTTLAQIQDSELLRELHRLAVTAPSLAVFNEQLSLHA